MNDIKKIEKLEEWTRVFSWAVRIELVFIAAFIFFNHTFKKMDIIGSVVNSNVLFLVGATGIMKLIEAVLTIDLAHYLYDVDLLSVAKRNLSFALIFFILAIVMTIYLKGF